MVDIANDTSTGAELDLVNGEGSFNGVFETWDGDIDWIKVVVDDAGLYDVGLTGGDAWSNIAIAVYDSEGVLVSDYDAQDEYSNGEEYTQFDLEVGTYFLSVRSYDGWSEESIDNANYTVTMSQVDNTAPTFSAEDTLTGVNEGTAAVYSVSDLLGNASDADLDLLSISGNAVTVKNGSGTTIGTADYSAGNFTINLTDPDYNGTVKLTYTVTDGTDTVAGSATYNVSSVNDAPTFSGEDTLTGVNEGTAAVFSAADLLDNADDVDGTPSIQGNAVTVKDSEGNTIGTADYSAGNYTINLTDEDYNGTVNLTYVVTDGTDTVAGSATYEVAAVNDAPTWSGPLTLTGVNEGTDASFTVEQLLFNASDVDGTTPSLYSDSLSVLNSKDEKIGTSDWNGDGYTITLDDEDYAGTVYLEYTFGDGGDGVNATASYVVAAVNDDPTGTAAVISDTAEDTPFSLTKAQLLANISDIEDADEDLTITIGMVVGGTFVYNAETSEYDFTPTANFHGDASITYTVTDSEDAEIEVTSEFSITSVNDAG
ncbi:cadherin-like domain-containing protein, partial [Asticcacaulis biprosthecium]